MSQLSDLEKLLEEAQANVHAELSPDRYERIRELKAQIAVEKWLNTFGPTDRETW